jgi:hypothetical protein
MQSLKPHASDSMEPAATIRIGRHLATVFEDGPCRAETGPDVASTSIARQLWTRDSSLHGILFMR